jgi:ribose transport system permease protein
MSEKIKRKIPGKNLNAMGSYIVKLVIATIILVILMSAFIPHFFSGVNFVNVLNSTAITGIISFGMTMVIITGAIDLSVGSLVALTSVVICQTINAGLPAWVAIVMAILSCAIFGLINSFFVSKLKINAFIITMGTMSVVRGLAYIIIGGRPKPFVSNGIRFFGKEKLFGVIPYPVIFMIITVAVIWYILKHTQFGRNVYAIGNNAETARLSGINVLKTRTLVFVIMSLLCAVAGFLLTAQAYSGIPQAGEGYELDAITAVVLGGAAMEGGSGTVLGTLLGTVIVAFVMNGMNLLSVPYFYQLLVKGIIVICAMVIANTRKNK